MSHNLYALELCKTIQNCGVATSFNHDGVLISVGVYFRERNRFVTCCVQDPLAGCQHLNTRMVGAFILLERITRVLRLMSFHLT